MNQQYPICRPFTHQATHCFQTRVNRHITATDCFLTICATMTIIPSTISDAIAYCDPAWWRRNNSSLPLVDTLLGPDDDGVVFSVTSWVLIPIIVNSLTCLSLAN